MHAGTKGVKMPKPYQPAVFQPTIRPSWAGSFEYIPEKELSQILKAITVFPNVDVPDSAFWNQTVKPDLEQQYQNFINTCEKRGRGARTYWGEHKLSLSNTYDNHKNTISITQGNLCKDKDKNKDKDKDNKEGVGEIDFDTPFQAGGQFWVLPPQFRKLALTKYTESEIREFEMTHSCHENPEQVCLNDIKHEKPKPKKTEKKSYGEQQKVKLTDEEYVKLQVLYGNRLDLGIQKLDTYLAQSVKNEKKYTNHYAVMRKNNWVYNEAFKEDYLPPEPEIADKSKFVRAKPL